jgi:hypothetical protein
LESTFNVIDKGLLVKRFSKFLVLAGNTSNVILLRVYPDPSLRSELVLKAMKEKTAQAPGCILPGALIDGRV